MSEEMKAAGLVGSSAPEKQALVPLCRDVASNGFLEHVNFQLYDILVVLRGETPQCGGAEEKPPMPAGLVDELATRMNERVTLSHRIEEKLAELRTVIGQ